MPEPRDKVLYEKIKNEISSKYKHSAYRSGMIVKEYKRAYEAKHKSKDSYIGSRENSNLKRWFDEVWLNQRGLVGYQQRGDVYRPTVRVTKDTPITFGELSKNKIQRAMQEKKATGRVKRF